MELGNVTKKRRGHTRKKRTSRDCGRKNPLRGEQRKGRILAYEKGKD